MSSNPCIYMDYGSRDHLNSRLWLRVAVWQHRSKSITVGLGCCGLQAERRTCLWRKRRRRWCVFSNAALYKWILPTFNSAYGGVWSQLKTTPSSSGKRYRSSQLFELEGQHKFCPPCLLLVPKKWVFTRCAQLLNVKQIDFLSKLPKWSKYFITGS